MLLTAGALSFSLLAPVAQSDSLPAFNSLRTPASPAFVLLGVAPTVVERPNTPADLAVSVLNRATGARLPRDVALEISPYWMLKHPTLRWQDDTVRSLLTSISRTATISVATADVGTNSRPVTGLALGLRAAIASGHLSAGSIERLRHLGDLLTSESRLIEEFSRAKRRELQQQLTRSLEHASKDDSTRLMAQTDSALGLFLRHVRDADVYRAAVESTETAFRDLALIRQGLVLEVAGGAVWHAPSGVADSARVRRWGAWFTAGYETAGWSFVAVNRFLKADTGSNVLDVGVRLIRTERRWAVSAEGVFRSFTSASAPPTQHRIVGNFDYEWRKGLWITGTFGRDFDKNAAGSLLAQFGLSFGIAGKRVETP